MDMFYPTQLDGWTGGRDIMNTCGGTGCLLLDPARESHSGMRKRETVEELIGLYLPREPKRKRWEIIR